MKDAHYKNILTLCFFMLFAIMTTVGIVGLSRNGDPIVLYAFLACSGVIGMMILTTMLILDFCNDSIERRRKRALQTANPLLIV
jgi:surface polysaccharide O-acyltransferase-like enzyme